jgi:signal transduction histidine kinase
LKPFLLSIWLLAFLTAPAQTEGLEKSLAHAKGHKRLMLLETLSRKLENTDIKRATVLAKEAVTLASTERNQHKEQQLAGWLGYLFRLQNSYDSASLFYDKALLIAREREDASSCAEYLNGFSQLVRARGKLSEAIEYAIEAHRYAEQAKDLKQMGDAVYNIGYVHQTQKSYDSALLYFRKSLKVRRQAGDSLSVAGSYNGIGLVFMRKEDYDQARYWFMKAASMITQENNPRLLSMVFNNTGITYEDQGKFAEGRKYYYQSIDLKIKLGDKRGLASTYGNLGDNYYESGNPDEAIKFARLSMALSKETHSLDYLITAHKILSRAYEKKADFKNAYENFVLYHNFQDSLFNTNKAKQVHEMIAKYNVEKKDKENEKLKASAALNETALTRQKFIIIGAAISLGIVLFVMNFLYKLYSRSKKMTLALAQQKAQAEQVNAQLTLAMQDNMNITKFMVHDLRAPLSKVAGFTNLIQKDGVLNPRQTTYASKLMEVVEQGRKLIDDLLTINRPQEVNVKQFDCLNFLYEMVQQFAIVAEQKKITISTNLPYGAVIIESDRELVGRVIDNLLSNAIKFSPFECQIVVSLREEADWVSISVTDEGPGFTEADQMFLYQKFKRLSAQPTNGESSTGLGLAIAKNIMDQLGGTIMLATQYGQGSTFTIVLPKKRKQ